MTGASLLLSADHADPVVAAREVRRRYAAGGANTVDDERLVDAVVTEGFEEPVARAAVATLSAHGDPTRSCASSVEPYASDD